MHCAFITKIARECNFSDKPAPTVPYLCNRDENRRLHIPLPTLPRPQPHPCRSRRHRTARENARPPTRAASPRRRPSRSRHPRHPLRLRRVPPQMLHPDERHPHHDPEQRDVSLHRPPVKDPRRADLRRHGTPAREHPRFDLLHSPPLRHSGLRRVQPRKEKQRLPPRRYSRLPRHLEQPQQPVDPPRPRRHPPPPPLARPQRIHRPLILAPPTVRIQGVWGDGREVIAQKYNKIKQLHTHPHPHSPQTHSDIATAADIPARLNRPNRCQTYIDIVGTKK